MANARADRSGATDGAAHPATPAPGSYSHDVETFRIDWPRTGIVDSSQAERFLARTPLTPHDNKTPSAIPCR